MTSQSVLLVGANPIVRLFDGEQLTVAVSMWQVDWSPHGAGTAVVLWHANRIRLIGGDPELTRWLAEDFTRHFPEFAGLTWTPSEVEDAPVELRIDLATGLLLRAGDVTVEMSDVLDRRAFATDQFDLGGVAHGLSLVLAPVGSATVRVAGSRVPGSVKLDGTARRPSSSAFLTGAEVWTSAAT